MPKLDKYAKIHFEPSGKYMNQGTVKQQKRNNKKAFKELLSQYQFPDEICTDILNQLKDTFTYKEIESVIKNALQHVETGMMKNKLKYDILSLVIPVMSYIFFRNLYCRNGLFFR